MIIRHNRLGNEAVQSLFFVFRWGLDTSLASGFGDILFFRQHRNKHILQCRLDGANRFHLDIRFRKQTLDFRSDLLRPTADYMHAVAEKPDRGVGEFFLERCGGRSRMFAADFEDCAPQFPQKKRVLVFAMGSRILMPVKIHDLFLDRCRRKSPG